MTTTTRASGEAGTSSTDATPTSFSLEARTHHTHKPPYKYQAAVLQLLRPVLSFMSVAKTFFTLTHNETIKNVPVALFVDTTDHRHFTRCSLGSLIGHWGPLLFHSNRWWWASGWVRWNGPPPSFPPYLCPSSSPPACLFAPKKTKSLVVVAIFAVGLVVSPSFVVLVM